MAKPELNPAVADQVPWSESLTEYDERHLVTYLRLLDADADGASRAEMARLVLGLDMGESPERAVRALESHLERARWMTEKGFLEFLK